jgi:hypothetical protein
MRSVKLVSLLGAVVGGCSSDGLGPRTIMGNWVQDFTVPGSFMEMNLILRRPFRRTSDFVHCSQGIDCCRDTWSAARSCASHRLPSRVRRRTIAEETDSTPRRRGGDGPSYIAPTLYFAPR